MTLLGTRYDVYKTPPVSGQTLRANALSNAIEYGDPGDSVRTATAVGRQSVHAAAYSIENGVSYLSPTRSTDVSSYAHDISPNTGVVVGSVIQANTNGWERAFRYENGVGFQLLGDVYEAVAELEAEVNGVRGSTVAWQINDSGSILISSGGSYYLLGPGGELRPTSVPDCAGVDLNEGGYLPPAGTLGDREGTPFCAISNRVHNATGTVAGEIWDGDPASSVRPHRNGAELAGATGSAATSVNANNWIGGSRGFVWNESNEQVDLKEALIAECGEPTSIRSGVDATYVNDQNWMQWASWIFSPQCPQVTFSSSGTGFEFYQGSPSVRVGNRFTTTLTITNTGRVPLEGFTVTTTPGYGSLFTRISGPTLSGTLAPGESRSSTVELEAVAPGVWTGQNVVAGSSNCGDISFTSPMARIVSLGDITELKVNSTADRPRAVSATTCDTGTDLDNGDAECTLRAAIQEVIAGRGSSITFDVPGAAVPLIALQSQLPEITNPVKIDGTTQSGGRVEIRGAAGWSGLRLRGGDSVITGLVLNGFTEGQSPADDTDVAAIHISGPGGNSITGNYIGTDATGTARLANENGIVIKGSPNNVVGGEGEDANVISGNEVGILITDEGANSNRIDGNLIGLSADGDFLRNKDGVVVAAGTGNVIGGAVGNRIASIEYGVFVVGLATPVVDTEIRGNFIGLNGNGTAAGSPSQRSVGIGVRAFLGDASSIDGTRVLDNRVAGTSEGIWLAEAGTTKARVAGNRIGLVFNDSGALPTGMAPMEPSSGVRLDGVPGAVVEDNIIAGQRWGVLVAGSSQSEVVTDENGEPAVDIYVPTSPLTTDPGSGNDVQIVGNTIGLNGQGSVPTGALQEYGITVYSGAAFTSIENNTVAGYSVADIWLTEASNVTVAGNRIGTANGTDHGSRVGVWVDDVDTVLIGGPGLAGRNLIARQSDVAILVEGFSEDVSIFNNYIGTDVLGASPWANGTGIRVTPSGEGDPSLQIVDNVIGGSGGAAVEILNPGNTQIYGNRIGVSPTGVPVANGAGLRLTGTPAFVSGNTIAHNDGAAIDIVGTANVQITGNSIYENDFGIEYETQPFAAPQQMLVMRTKVDDEGKIGLFYAVLPTDQPGEVTIEVFGNRSCASPQGRVLLGSHVVAGDEPVIKFLAADAMSAFGQLEGFTATATSGESTSRFSACADVQPFIDSDDDGSFDLFELLAGDRNNDGIPDVTQSNVATHLATTLGDGEGTEFVTLVSAPGTTLQQSSVINADLPPLEGVTYTVGLIQFDIQGVPDGTQTTVDVILESGTPASAVQYIKVPRVDSASFRVLPETGTGDRAERTGSGWRLYLTDGGEWDVDGTVNGRIRDPGGPVRIEVVATSPPPRRGGGGAVDFALLALLAAGVLCVRSVRRAPSNACADRS